MPSSLALVKAYWDGAARQRAVSLWSIGSWGGSGLGSLFGGLMAQNFGWRWIFFASIAVALAGLWLVRGTPESKAAGSGHYKFDLPGVLTFMVTMVALQVLVTQGTTMGWASPRARPDGNHARVRLAVFRAESGNPQGFVDFSLFSNSVYTGATVSNFLINSAVGMQLVSLQLVQIGGGMTAQQAGILTLGYAIAIIAFIRVGEKLLQRFGPRQPMIWGCFITGISIAFLMPANLLLADYRIVAIIGYTLFGVGLAFYATPSTDAALSSLPDEPVRLRLGHLQDGLVAGRGARRGDLRRDLHGAQRPRRRRALAGGRDYISGPAGQPRRARGRHRRTGLQPADGGRGDHVDHAHHS